LKVLDAACGVGYGSYILANSGAHWVTGIDVSEDAISYAKKHYAQSNVTFKKCDAEQLSLLGEVFDIVISFETIEHLNQPRKFIQEVHRSLKRGGLFICSTPNKEFAGK